MQKIFLHGLLAGLVSAIVCLFYSEVYSTSLQVDFSDVINIFSVMGTCLFGSLIASAGYYFLSTKLSDGDVTDVLFNITFLTLTFLSCIYPFSPELFPGLVIPMHFFPVLFWIAFNPIFKHGRT
jgi:hypothetical protein